MLVITFLGRFVVVRANDQEAVYADFVGNLCGLYAVGGVIGTGTRNNGDTSVNLFYNPPIVS